MIAFPVLVLLIFGIIEMGAAWRTFQVATNTAREGARLTVLPNADETDVRAEMANRLTQGGLDPASATIDFVCTADCFAAGRTTGEGAEVRVTYPFDFVFLGPIVNYIGGNGSAWGTVNMETGFVMRIE
jgi:Flp pilus assembly protein TadG